MNSEDAAALIIVVTIAITCFIAIPLGYFSGKSDVQKDAVRNNCAVWTASENGTAIFTWKVAQEVEK